MGTTYKCVRKNGSDSMITVIDALMGAGKTSFAIQYINQHPDENILYIALYLEEDKRIGDNVERVMMFFASLFCIKLQKVFVGCCTCIL